MKLTNNFNLPSNLVEAIKKTIYDPRDRDPKRVGITTLISNPLPKLLAIKHWDDIEEDVSNHLWRILGSSVHSTIENLGKHNTNTFTEQKLELEIDGITVVGKLDLYDISELSVEDWKVTSVYSIIFGKHKEWEEQLNPYAYLLRIKGYEVNKLVINAFLRDWRDGESKKNPQYPEIQFKTINVKQWPMQKQEEFLRERVRIYKEALAMPIDQVAICSPEERWAKEDVFAVVKNANKTASRLLPTLEEAQEWASKNIDKKDKFRIDKRTGEDLRCQRYCSSNKFCKYYQETYMK